MRLHWVYSRTIRLALAAVALLAPLAGFPGSPQYPKTVAALQERYADEVQAHQKYGAYAEQAGEEGYPQIAYLFTALAASETVHARNFKALLGELGVQDHAPAIGFEIATTRENLQQATHVETDEIDREYPEILEQIRPENHAAAIRDITYAWEAEKQHRDLIVKIHGAASRWFGLLVRRIEGEPTHYYVCRVCGSTLTEVPAEWCPICGHSIEHYEAIPGFPEADAALADPALQHRGRPGQPRPLGQSLNPLLSPPIASLR